MAYIEAWTLLESAFTLLSPWTSDFKYSEIAILLGDGQLRDFSMHIIVSSDLLCLDKLVDLYNQF